MVNMVGFIDIPAHNTIEFMLATDDGGRMEIGNAAWGNWVDQGCTWMMSGNLTLQAGSNAFTVWMYENGGATCLMLAWKINNTGWVIVPDSAFTQTATTTTTTTTTTSTTTTSTTTTTTTTIPETTTTTSSSTSSTSTTTLPSTTTTIQLDTTTSMPSTTTTTTTTIPPTTTTTQAPYTPPQTTTTSEPVASTTSSTTTTTSLLEPETTVEETYPETTTSLVTVPISSSTLPAETTTTTTEPTPETSTTQTTQPEAESSSTTTIPDPEPDTFTEEELEEFVEELDIVKDEPISNEKVEQILEVLKDAAPAQIVAAIEQVLTTNISSEQAVSIASSPEVLAAVTEDQAEAIFEKIVVEELTLKVAEELVEVLNEAPVKVKKAFQETINVFAGVFDSFQMVGQTIPVGERRTLVAVSNTLVAVGATLRRKDK